MVRRPVRAGKCQFNSDALAASGAPLPQSSGGLRGASVQGVRCRCMTAGTVRGLPTTSGAKNCRRVLGARWQKRLRQRTRGSALSGVTICSDGMAWTTARVNRLALRGWPIVFWRVRRVAGLRSPRQLL